MTYIESSYVTIYASLPSAISLMLLALFKISFCDERPNITSQNRCRISISIFKGHKVVEPDNLGRKSFRTERYTILISKKETFTTKKITMSCALLALLSFAFYVVIKYVKSIAVDL